MRVDPVEELVVSKFNSIFKVGSGDGRVWAHMRLKP